MNAIRIRKKLESISPTLPELAPFVGRTVEIIVFDELPPGGTPGTGDWDVAQRAAQELRELGYDFDAFLQQREYDISSYSDS